MSQKISPLAGKPAPKSILIDIAKLLAAYADLKPDPAEASQRVAFGTSGQRMAHPGDQPGDLRIPQE
jgi:phosphoglucomutase